MNAAAPSTAMMQRSLAFISGGQRTIALLAALACLPIAFPALPRTARAEPPAVQPTSLTTSVSTLSSSSGSATPTRTDTGETPESKLTGRQIYKRVLDNRFDTFIQTSKLVSGDRSGHEQDTKLRMWFENFRDANEKPRDGLVLSKSLVRYLAPFDMRHTSYLVVNNLDRANDQFVYMNSSRKVRRVNLRGEAVFGTDFSFEDVIPKELEDATYERLEDGEVAGKPCFVIEATPLEIVESQYSRIRVWVDKARPVVLQTHYWDDRNIQIKELHVDSEQIELINGVWVPLRMTMRHLKMQSYSTLEVTKIEPNVELQRSHFDLTRLQGH